MAALIVPLDLRIPDVIFLMEFLSGFDAGSSLPVDPSVTCRIGLIVVADIALFSRLLGLWILDELLMLLSCGLYGVLSFFSPTGSLFFFLWLGAGLVGQIIYY